MTTPKSETDISGLRAEIDRVDRALLQLMAERLSLAENVRDAKSGASVWRPAREESLVRELVLSATGPNPPLVSRIWAELVSASLAIQGPMQLHVCLEGDKLAAWTLVRDRFGAALPMLSYPTASSALAGAGADPQGVAILPSPGGMNSWWAALCPGGALDHLKIHTGLPRVRNADWPRDDWPRAVAVAGGEVEPSGADRWLIVTKSGRPEKLRAETGEWKLYAVDDPGEEVVIGILPDPLPHA